MITNQYFFHGINILVATRKGLIAATMMCVFSCTAQAQTSNDGTKTALAKAQYMLRQISTEKTNLEKEISLLKTEKNELQKEIEKYKAENTKKQAEVNKQLSALEGLSKESHELQNNIEDTKEKYSLLQNENQRLLDRLATQTENFDICYKNNKTLYSVNQEILGQYENKGFWDALSQKEPLTAVGKVKVENLIQDYQYKMQDLEVKLLSEGKPE